MSEIETQTDWDALVEKLRAVRRELRDEYLQPHLRPWIIGFSGGKDSTRLAHLVLECPLAIAPDQRRRQVYLVSNDTLVESPVFQDFVNRMLARLIHEQWAQDKAEESWRKVE